MRYKNKNESSPERITRGMSVEPAMQNCNAKGENACGTCAHVWRARLKRPPTDSRGLHLTRWSSVQLSSEQKSAARWLPPRPPPVGLGCQLVYVSFTWHVRTPPPVRIFWSATMFVSWNTRTKSVSVKHSSIKRVWTKTILQQVISAHG